MFCGGLTPLGTPHGAPVALGRWSFEDGSRSDSETDMARVGRMHHKVATAAPSVTYRLADTRSKATTATDDDDDDRTDARSETDMTRAGRMHRKVATAAARATYRLTTASATATTATTTTTTTTTTARALGVRRA